MMENKVSYTLVGGFVFTLFIGAIVFVLWHANYAQDKSYKFYKVITNESVSGLNIKAPVKLMGVSVGEVEKLYINPKNSEEIVILIKVDAQTPIKTDSYAILKPQGITGLSYLEIEGGKKESPLLQTSSEEKSMGVIFTKPSLLSRFDNSFATIVTNIEQTLNSLQATLEQGIKIMNETNVKHIEQILSNTNEISQNISQNSHKFSHLFDEAIATTNQIGQMTSHISRIATIDTTKMLASVDEAAQSVNRLMNKIEQRVDSGIFDIDMLLAESLDSFESTMNELNALILQLQQSPSDILYKSTEQKLGPGEKR